MQRLERLRIRKGGKNQEYAYIVLGCVQPVESKDKFLV